MAHYSLPNKVVLIEHEIRTTSDLRNDSKDIADGEKFCATASISAIHITLGNHAAPHVTPRTDDNDRDGEPHQQLRQDQGGHEERKGRHLAGKGATSTSQRLRRPVSCYQGAAILPAAAHVNMDFIHYTKDFTKLDFDLEVSNPKAGCFAMVPDILAVTGSVPAAPRRPSW